ncbi:Uncharacterized protein Fot_09170 [Forsythia ovata]|uniref:Uncharacterized protein n=1 Tax=Forsythia ovata TaxID=205694 RepID=A0ABD1WGZ2_9LAMI
MLQIFLHVFKDKILSEKQVKKYGLEAGSAGLEAGIGTHGLEAPKQGLELTVWKHRSRDWNSRSGGAGAACSDEAGSAGLEAHGHGLPDWNSGTGTGSSPLTDSRTEE